MPHPTFCFRPDAPDPATTIYVDGTEDGYRSLSHWPGNTTPSSLKRDLSTDIALAFAALPPAEQSALLGPFSVVANNHYDTDGVLAAFAVLRPDEALPRRDAMLAAAATGDFGTWNGSDALAVELTVMNLTTAAGSPLPMAPGASDQERHGAAYLWLLDHLPAILDEPFGLSELWTARHHRILDDVAFVEAGRGLDVVRHTAHDLAVVETDRELTMLGLNHAAGSANRVLLVQPAHDGHRYRFLYRDESWFDVVSRRPPARVALDAVVARLQDAEPAGSTGRWWSTGIAVPVAQLGFSGSGEPPDGFFDDPALSRDPVSALDVATVVDTLCAAFGD